MMLMLTLSDMEPVKSWTENFTRGKVNLKLETIQIAHFLWSSVHVHTVMQGEIKQSFALNDGWYESSRLSI